MQLDLKAATDIATYALFDPAAMLHVINNGELNHIDEDVTASDTEQGNLLLYSWGSDGGARFRIFVDEAPGDDVVALARGKQVRGVLLRVPSGTLWATGLEYLWRQGEGPVTASEYRPSFDHMGQSAEIPAGNYLVDAFDVRPPEPPRSRVSRLLGLLTCAGCVVTLIGLAACIIAPLVGVALAEDWSGVWQIWSAAMLAIWAPVILAWVADRNLPSSRRQAQAARERELRFPFDAVVVLRPLPQGVDPASLPGGRFGTGRFEEGPGGETPAQCDT